MYIRRVDRELLAFSFRRLETDLVEHALHDGMQSPSADIFRAFVYAESKASDFVERVRRGVEAGVLDGDETDLAHAIVALVQGLALAENARRLGTSAKSIERRWQLAIDALLAGLAPAGSARRTVARASRE